MAVAFRAKLLVSAAACAVAMLAATPARAQDDGASAFESLIARLIDGEDASASERQAMFERFETEAEILFARAEQAAQRCDEPGMIAATLQLDRLVSSLAAYVDRNMPGVTVRALATARALLSNARGLQLQNCSAEQREETLNKLLDFDPATALSPEEERAYFDKALREVRRLYQQAQDAAKRCDAEALRAITGRIEQIVAQLETYLGQNPRDFVVRAVAEGKAYLSNIEQLRLENCPQGTGEEATEQLTTGPSPTPVTGQQSQEQPTTPPQADLPPAVNIAAKAYAAWGEGLDAVDICDLAKVEAALAELRGVKALAEANVNRVLYAPRATSAQYDDARNLVERIGQYISQIERLRLDCAKKEEAKEHLRIGDLGLQLVQDSSEWCTFGTTDPRDLPTDEPGDDPRDGPGTDDGDDPRDGPEGTPDDGDDPRDTPDDGDDPRDAPLPDPWDDPRDEPTDADDPRDGPGVSIPTPAGDDPRDEDEEEDDPRDEDDDDDPRDAPTVPLVVKATSAAQAGGQVQQAVSGQQVKLFAPSQIPANIELPVGDAPKPQTDASAEPLSCTTGADGQCTIPVPVCELGACENGVPAIPASGLELEVSAENSKSYNVLADAGTQLGAGLDPFVIGRTPAADGREWITVLASGDLVGALQSGIGQLQGLIGSAGLHAIEENLCRTKQQTAPNDPYFNGKGAWGQQHDDQWAIKRVGLTGGADSAWARLGANPREVVVAVIDSGLDWNHADFDWGNIWNNPGETPGNGVDDDGNGYVDDVIGWDFLSQNNKPWDHDGHGTLTAGIIAADSDNGVGIAGINPHAKVMVLKALNAFGHSRASFIAHAIRYAADNGARVASLSVGGPGLTGIERDAIAYARGKGVLIVVASGNDGVEVADYGIAASDQVLTVAASGLSDEHPNFSNWGPGIDLAAPGADVLSLRARRTDTVRGIPDVPYADGEAYVGADKRYYRVTGTSFAAPIVAGVASLVLSKRPELTVEQLEAVLVQSAEDIQTPGRDNFSGAGLVDARAALDFDPSVSVEAAIAGVEVVRGEGGPAVRVNGTIAADRLASARIEIGAGRQPAEFRTVASGLAATTGALADIPADDFRAAREWTIRLVVTHANGTEREARFLLDVGG